MMKETIPRFNRILAFEVAKDSLVVHALPAERQVCIANRPAAIRRLLRTTLAQSEERFLVVCEATGGYEKHVLDAACSLGIACHRAHGARVRHFAKYAGIAAKTDAIDARVLALYALKTSVRLYQPLTPEEKAVRALKARRDEIQQMLIAESNRLEHVDHPNVRTGIRAHIKTLKLHFVKIERDIAALITQSPRLKARADLMKTVIGIGQETAIAVIAYLPELGALSKGEAARLTGLAPIAKDSGKMRGRRHIEPGRNAVRRALYMAAIVAMRWNPRLKLFALRLKAKGKPFKLVATAIMRKLVVILNAVLQSGKPALNKA